MEKPEKDAIRSLLNFLCENTTAVDQLTTHAISASLMTEPEREKILAYPTQYLQNDGFYVHMMKKPKGMDHLLRFLRDVLNDGLAQRLEEQLTIEKISVRFQNTQMASSSSSGHIEVQSMEGYAGPNISAKQAAQLPLRTHFNLHFPSRYFTGRKSHLLTLDKTVKRLLEKKCLRNKIVVVSGLGGVGKTELVREYATTTDAVTYVIVINAASYTTAKKDFNDLAVHVQTKRTSDQEISMNQTIYDVYRYFSLKMDGKTLFILENARHWARFSEFLPNESVGTGNNQLPQGRALKAAQAAPAA